MLENNDRPTRAEHMPDPMDQAAAVSEALVEDAIAKQLARSKATNARWAPRTDGLCACGCGDDVDPRRLALGYGLTIECAELRTKRG